MNIGQFPMGKTLSFSNRSSWVSLFCMATSNPWLCDVRSQVVKWSISQRLDISDRQRNFSYENKIGHFMRRQSLWTEKENERLQSWSSKWFFLNNLFHCVDDLLEARRPMLKSEIWCYGCLCIPSSGQFSGHFRLLVHQFCDSIFDISSLTVRSMSLAATSSQKCVWRLSLETQLFKWLSLEAFLKASQANVIIQLWELIFSGIHSTNPDVLHCASRWSL